MEGPTSPSSDTAPIDSFGESLRWRLLVLQGCVLSIFLVIIWFWPVGPQYVAIPPSFSCATATLETEKAICADPLLEKTDADFAVYYRDNLEVATSFRATAVESALRRSEADFIAARNRCGRNRWCIERQYLHQDLHIADISGEPHRVTTPLKVYVNHYVGAYFELRMRRVVRSLIAGTAGSQARTQPR